MSYFQVLVAPLVSEDEEEEGEPAVEVDRGATGDEMKAMSSYLLLMEGWRAIQL